MYTTVYTPIHDRMGGFCFHLFLNQHTDRGMLNGAQMIRVKYNSIPIDIIACGLLSKRRIYITYFDKKKMFFLLKTLTC